MAMGHLD
jgi:hypothetical protein